MSKKSYNELQRKHAYLQNLISGNVPLGADVDNDLIPFAVDSLGRLIVIPISDAVQGTEIFTGFVELVLPGATQLMREIILNKKMVFRHLNFAGDGLGELRLFRNGSLIYLCNTGYTEPTKHVTLNLDLESTDNITIEVKNCSIVNGRNNYFFSAFFTSTI